MNDYVVAKMLLNALVSKCVGITTEQNLRTTIGNYEPAFNGVNNNDNKNESYDRKNCGGFLCDESSCKKLSTITPNSGLFSLMNVLGIIVDDPENVIMPALKRDPNWADYLDRQQVFSLKGHNDLVELFSL